MASIKAKKRPPTDPHREPVRYYLESVITDLTGQDNKDERWDAALRDAKVALNALDNPPPR